MIKDFLDFLGLQEFYSNLKNIFALKSEVKNKQSDWNVTNTNDSAYIKNKPNITLEIISTDQPDTDLNPGDFWMHPY